VSAPPVNLFDFEAWAQARTNPSVWDFVAGGSEDEVTLRANRVAFGRWFLRPHVLAGVRTPDLSVELLGRRLRSPVLLAPVGYQGLLHPDGELATARAAAAIENVMVVSTMSNATLEEIATAGGGAQQWFQLYMMKDHGLTHSLVERAELAGYDALVVTVDAPRTGRRERDLRNGFMLQNQLRPRNLPAADDWEVYRGEPGRSAVAAYADDAFEPAADWSAIERLLRQTSLPLLLKGVLTTEDARHAVDLGVRGIVVSNHGGRQLDSAIASLDALPEVVEATGGRCDVLVDGGVRRGTDALKARALGARAVLIGRPYLWGLSVRGADGVVAVLRMLEREIEHALTLSGRGSWAGVDRSLVVAP
jgi:isopentenyl diphosphate isomerase/L-lactate dehydrogenase-like FMN-dependent dehydrogenase